MPRSSSQNVSRNKQFRARRQQAQASRRGTPRANGVDTADSNGVLVHRAPRFRPQGAVVRFTNIVSTGTITASTSAVNGVFSFIANSSADFASRAQVFDDYRLAKIQMIIKPLTQQQAPNTGALTNPSLLYIAVDNNDTSAPSAPSDVLQYQDVTILAPGQGCVIDFTPHVLLGTNSGTNAVTTASPWIACTAGAEPHLGIKYSVTAGIATSVPVWVVYSRYWIEFRNPR